MIKKSIGTIFILAALYGICVWPASAQISCDVTVGPGDVGGLISALLQANVDDNVQSICLSESTYTLTGNYNDDSLLPFIRDDVTIHGNGAEIVGYWTTTATTQSFLFYVNGPDVDFELNNLTLSAGRTYVPDAKSYSLTDVSLLEHKVIIRQYTSVSLTRVLTDGGGKDGVLDISLAPGNTDPVSIVDSVFQNHANASVIKHRGGDLVIRNSQFINNGSSDARYGSVFYLANTTFEIHDSLFRGNSGEIASIFYLNGYSDYSGETFGTVTGTTFNDNVGYILSTTYRHNLAITDSCFINASPGYFVYDGSNPTITTDGNWWGWPMGPSMGTGSVVDSGVDASPLTVPSTNCQARYAFQPMHRHMQTPINTPVIIENFAFGGTYPYTENMDTAPAHGSHSFDSGAVTYNPAQDFVGLDEFTLQVTDADGQVVSTKIFISVGDVKLPTIRVDSSEQEIPPLANGNCTLGEALLSAQLNRAFDACAPGSPIDEDVVILQPDTTYTLHTVDNEHAGPNGLPLVNGPVSIIGNHATIQRLENANDFRILSTTVDGILSLQDLTIENGRLPGPFGGAGIFLQSDGKLENVVFHNNAATGRGGALFAYDDLKDHHALSLTIDGGLFTSNHSGHDGGAFNASKSVDLTIKNSVFEDNSSDERGGAFFALPTQFEDSIIRNNYAIDGGAFFYDYIYESETTASRLLVENNTSPGILFNMGYRLTLNDSAIINNSSAGVGGINYLTISNSCFSGNLPTAISFDPGMYLQNNWWGTYDGPAPFNGHGERIEVRFGNYDTWEPFFSQPIDLSAYGLPCPANPPVIDTVLVYPVSYFAPSTITLVAQGGMPPYTYTVTTPPTLGTLSEFDGGVITYTPLDETIDIDFFTATVTNSTGESTDVTVYLERRSLLSAEDRQIETVADRSLPIQLAYNGRLPYSVVLDSTPEHGALDTFSAGPDFIYTPEADYVGLDTFAYTLTDADGYEVSASITLSVREPLQDLTYYESGSPNNLGLVPLNITTGVRPYAFTLLHVPDNMVVEINQSQLRIVPNFDGIEMLTVGIEDAIGDQATLEVYFTTQAPPYIPTAYYTALASTPILLQPESVGGALPHTVADIWAENGTIAADVPPFVYVPDEGFTGWDSGHVEIRDGIGFPAYGTLMIHVLPPPSLEEHIYNVPVNQSFVIDTTVEYDYAPLTYTVSQPLNGIVTGSPPLVTYTPEQDFIGEDTFEVTVMDAIGGQDTYTVILNVSSFDPPFAVASEVYVETAFDTPKFFALDVLGGQLPLQYEVIGGIANGNISESNDVFTYTPAPGFDGLETIMIEISDQESRRIQTTVMVTVVGPVFKTIVNIAPGDIDGLIAAIEEANTSGIPTEIHLAEGASYTFDNAYGAVEVQNALPIISGQIRLLGFGATLQTASTPLRYFDVAETGYLELAHSLLLGDDASQIDGNGGAIHNSGTLRVDNVQFLSNHTNGLGGAVYSSGDLEINHSIFMGNSASSGGAIYLSGSSSAFAAEININQFEANTAIVHGGAIYSAGGVDYTLAIARNEFLNNTPGAVFSDTGLDSYFNHFAYNAGALGMVITRHQSVLSRDNFVSSVGGIGLYIETGQTDVTYSAFSEGSVAIHVAAGPVPASLGLYDSCLAYQTQTAIHFVAGAVLDIGKTNWWGAYDGPSGPNYLGGGTPLTWTLPHESWLDYLPVGSGCVAMRPVLSDVSLGYSPDFPLPFELKAKGGLPPYTVSVETAPTYGSLIPSDTLNQTYLPNVGAANDDIAVFTITDSAGNASTTTVNLLVTSLNANSDQVIETRQDIPIVFDLDPQMGEPPHTIGGYLQPLYGELIGGEGRMVYVPPTGFVGTDSFDYVTADAVGELHQHRVQIHVADPLPATIVVDSFEYEYPSQIDGNCTLTEAIVAANQNIAVDTCAAGNEVLDVIEIPAGVFTLPNDTALPELQSTVILRGAGIDQTVIQQLDHTYASLFTVRSDAVATIMNMKVIGAGQPRFGGAIYNSGHLSVYNVHFDGGKADTYGGAIYNSDATYNNLPSHLTVMNSIFTGNVAASASAIYVRDGSFQILYNAFEDNMRTDDLRAWGAGNVEFNCFARIFNQPGAAPEPPIAKSDGVIRWNYSKGTSDLQVPYPICDRINLPSFDIPAGDDEMLHRAIGYAVWTQLPTTITLAPNSVYQLVEPLHLMRGTITVEGNNAIIQPAPNVETRLIRVSGWDGESSFVINNVTLRDGIAEEGAVAWVDGQITFNNVQFLDNQATAPWGASVLELASHANVVVNHSRFEGNIAPSGSALDGAHAEIEVNDSVFINNLSLNTGITPIK